MERARATERWSEQLGRKVWTHQCRAFSKSWKKTSNGGNRPPLPANTRPRDYRQARRKVGSSWALYIGSVRRSTRVWWSNFDWGAIWRAAEPAFKTFPGFR